RVLFRSSPAKLGRMINHVLASEHEWPEMTARARMKVEENHDVSKQRLKLEELYLRVMKK
ncbi:hypothetical protein EN829_063355, partial [Mesorhizobium sp. M00.F.Ca.ET.186.01.1.1]